MASVKDAPPSRAPIRFGVFDLDPESGELRKQGVKVRLQEQPFQILLVLLEHPGNVVTREELQRRIWTSDTFVDFDRGLYNAVKKLREALGDSAESPRYIETLSRRGYRFAGAVNATSGDLLPAREDSAKAETETEPRASRRNLKIGIALGLGVAVLLLVLRGFVADKLWRRSGASAAPQIRSLAVLPLQNLSADPAQEYFSDGMTDALITDLAQISSVKVISRTSVMHYKKTDKTLPEIARELNVDGIVEGTVQRSGDQVRITAQLVHGASDKHLWATSYERDIRDVIVLERDVAGDIAHQVQARLTTQNQAPLAQPRPVNVKALEAYLQGNYHKHREGRGFGDDELRKAAECFQQAIDADPNFAPAYVGIASARADLILSSVEDRKIRRAAAEKAVALDPSSSDAHVTLGLVRWDDWDWPRAEEEYRRAVALNPNSADAHDALGDFLGAMGRQQESWNEYQIAQGLDPNKDHLSNALERGGEYDRAIELRRKMVEIDPDDGYAHLMLYFDYSVKGMHKEAIKELELTWSLQGLKGVAARVDRAFMTSGYRGALLVFAADFERLHAARKIFLPVFLARVYASLGDKDRAFYWLERAYERRDDLAGDAGLAYLKVDPGLGPLRSKPRYKDLLRRIGFPP
jgi:TolB-like protein/DNA-binding winged helix-turn-helix (wHTH) protein/Tfp pilus assembly protein PilF